MPKVLFVNSVIDTIQEARGMVPAGFELLIETPGSAGYAAALAEADYLLGNVEGMDDAFYRAAPRLRLVQLFSAGYDRVDLDAARRAGVLVANNGGANSRAVAEHTILLMLAVYRRLVHHHDMTAGGRWRGNQPLPTLYEMHGKTLGIVGYGTIGKRVARIAAGGFDMRVQYNDIVRLTEDAEDALDVRYRLLPELLRTSRHRHAARAADRAHAPPDRRRGAGADAAARRTDQCSRGPVIDFAALHEALTGGRIAGAGLNVFPAEPPSPSYRFVARQCRANAAPGGSQPGNPGKHKTRNAFDNVLRAARGERPLWVVPELERPGVARIGKELAFRSEIRRVKPRLPWWCESDEILLVKSSPAH